MEASLACPRARDEASDSAWKRVPSPIDLQRGLSVRFPKSRGSTRRSLTPRSQGSRAQGRRLESVAVMPAHEVPGGWGASDAGRKPDAHFCACCCTDQRPPPLPLIIDGPRGWVGGWLAGRPAQWCDLLSSAQQYSGIRRSTLGPALSIGATGRAMGNSGEDHFMTIRANRPERLRTGWHHGPLSVRVPFRRDRCARVFSRSLRASARIISPSAAGN